MRTKIWCILLVLAAAPVQAIERAATEDEKLLAKHAVAPTAEGVVAYLRALQPDVKELQLAAAWIAQLGDNSFAVRETAMRRLMEMSHVPVTLLQGAAEGADLEAATRAKRILQYSQTIAKLEAARSRRDLSGAVLRTIAARKIQGTTTILLETAPFLDDGLLMLAGDVAASVALPSDAPLLRKSMGDKTVAVRVVAIRGLVTAAGDAALPELRAQLRAADTWVALAAAQALAEKADRACLEVLVQLTVADKLDVRVRAVQVLRAATKQSFAENPYRTPHEQQAEFAKWKSWLAQNGASAKLYSPLEIAPLPEDLGAGLLLHYTFNDDSAGRLIDGSGHGRHGDIKNAVSYVARGRGKALQIEGHGHHGSEGGHATLPFIDFGSLKQFSLVIWVRETGMTHEEGEAYVTFGVDRDTNIQEALGIAHLNGSVLFRVGEGHVSAPFAAADLGRWVHYAMTFEGGRLSAYKNGEPVAVATARVSVPSRNAALGRHWWSGGAGTSTRFQGALDDLRVYDRALTPQQVRRLVESTK